MSEYVRLEAEFVLVTKVSSHLRTGRTQVAHKHDTADVDGHISPLPRSERVPVAGHD